MAWRPNEYVIEGELDNTNPGKVTGWIQFAGLKDKVTFDLKGDFHRDIRGAKVHFVGNAQGWKRTRGRDPGRRRTVFRGIFPQTDRCSWRYDRRIATP
jgi:hypothetical protein